MSEQVAGERSVAPIRYLAGAAVSPHFRTTRTPANAGVQHQTRNGHRALDMAALFRRDCVSND